MRNGCEIKTNGIFPKTRTRLMKDLADMPSPCILSSLIFLTLPLWCTAASQTQVTLNLASMVTDNGRIDVDPYISFGPKGLTWCAKECKRRAKCLSFGFRVSTLLCDLYNVSSTSTGAAIVADQGYLFSDASDWPDDMLGPCDNNQCPVSTRCETNVNNQAICLSTECQQDPPTVTNAAYPSSYVREIGSSVTYTCNPGYILQGPYTTTCMTTAEWSIPNVTCRDCGPPPSVPFATPAQSTGTAGSAVTYSCGSRAVVNGPAEVLCDTSGTWATPTFSCDIVFTNSVHGNSGVVVSPNYPGMYENNQRENITVTLDQQGPQSVRIELSYNLESRSSGGCYDYVKINDDGQLYCGVANVTKTITVQGNQWMVYFKSDGSNIRPGFYLSYNVI